jgi:plasmid maintenance system antidote protein VapI
MRQTMTDALRAAINGSELSISALAKAAGVDHGQVFRFLHGQRDLTLSTADKLAAVLNLSLQASSAGRRRRNPDS